MKSSQLVGKQSFNIPFTFFKHSCRSKQIYMAKLKARMAKIEKRAIKKFESRFIEYQLSKRKQVSRLERQISELKEQMQNQNKGITLNDILNMSLDRFIKAAFLTLIVLVALHYAHVI